MSLRRAPGEGSIYRRPDGRWQASLQADGKRRSVYGRTRSEVVQKLDALKRQAASSGSLPTPAKRTVNDLLDAWLEAVRPNLKPTTAAHYELLASTYVRPALGRILLAKLTPHRIQVHLGQLQDRPRVAQLAYHVLKQACDLAVRWRWLGENPCDKALRPQYHARRRTVWGAQQLRTFLDGTQGHWLGPLWAFLVTSGCRLGEALALEWGDVNMGAGVVTISKAMQRVGGEWVTTEPKTAAGERAVLLPAETVAVLRQQRGRQVLAGVATALVFPSPTGEPLHRAVAAHALQRECLRLGLPPVTPHGLRHLHASLLLAEGLPLPEVSRRLGHANTGITAQVYSHAIRDDTAAVAAIERALADRRSAQVKASPWPERG